MKTMLTITALFFAMQMSAISPNDYLIKSGAVITEQNDQSTIYEAEKLKAGKFRRITGATKWKSLGYKYGKTITSANYTFIYFRIIYGSYSISVINKTQAE